MSGPEVVHHGKQLQSSLVWLTLALFLGGLPLIVYFTTPQPKIANLWLALVLGLPLFVLSLVDLGRFHALILDPRSRRVKFIEGVFSRTRTRAFSYDEVREIHLSCGRLHSRASGPEEWYFVQVVFQGNRSAAVGGMSYEEATRCARRLGSEFAIRPVLEGKALVAAMEALPRSSSGSWKSVVTYVVFLLLGAIAFALAVIVLFVHLMMK